MVDNIEHKYIINMRLRESSFLNILKDLDLLQLGEFFSYKTKSVVEFIVILASFRLVIILHFLYFYCASVNF